MFGFYCVSWHGRYKHVTKTEHYWHNSSIVCQTYAKPKDKSEDAEDNGNIGVKMCMSESYPASNDIWNF
jgi:hypothetical protein